MAKDVEKYNRRRPGLQRRRLGGGRVRRLNPMRSEEIRRRLSELLPDAKERYGVQELWIFGSSARGEANESDLDVIVDFDGPATFDRYMGLKFFLEDSLDMQVDLATRRMLRPLLRGRIEREAVRVADADRDAD